jgi:4-oxalocrotonate tautomerase
MPNIYIEGPPIKDLDKKRKLVAEITDAAAEAFGLPKEAIIVTIRENLPENVAIGGRLLIDRNR